MSKIGTYEIGISAPGSYFKWGDTPMGGSWPAQVLELLIGLGGEVIAPSTRVTFELPAQFQIAQSAIERMRREGVEVVLDYKTRKNPSLADVHSVPFYSANVRIQSDGFLAGVMFRDQLRCGVPNANEAFARYAGCGFQKTQLRKLQIDKRKRTKVGDVIGPYVDLSVWPWQVLVVSSRFRDVMIRSEMTGFSFLPIAGPDANPDELLLSSGPCKSDSSDWYQWVITGRTRPIPIRDFTHVRGACEVCGQLFGEAQPYYLSQPVPLNRFDENDDIQICEQLEMPNGKQITWSASHLFVSSRFVELCVKEKFRGLTGLAGNSACFSALYFGPSL